MYACMYIRWNTSVLMQKEDNLQGFIWAKNWGGGGRQGRKSWSNNSKTRAVCVCLINKNFSVNFWGGGTEPLVGEAHPAGLYKPLASLICLNVSVM